ncbi:MAG: hypothetical protein JNL85_11910 [Rubrivivax sp.]|nr:hypothetical protein [Rubrivivax sp.]
MVVSFAAACRRRVLAALAPALALAACATAPAPVAAPVAVAAPGEAPPVPPRAAAAATAAAPALTAAVPAAAPLAAAAFGIEFLETRLSAAGSLVDLRYRVLDADKAAPLLDRKVRPVLVHVDTGKRYYVPQPPIVGALRQTTRSGQAPQPGRTYFMLFANPDRALKSGDTLALFVGDQRVGEFRILQ